MRYCIVYIANKEVQEYFKSTASDLSERFGIANLSNRVPAHITLKYPFESDSLLELEEKIENIVQSFQPVSIAVNGFNRFLDNKKTIFMEVDSDQKSTDTIKNCIEKLGHFDEDRKFSIEDRTFHISVARNMEPTISNKVFDYLKSKSQPHFKIMFDNIALMEFGDEIWHVKKVFEFK